MTSKRLNIIMLVCLILFSIIFGVSATLRAIELKKLDDEYEQNVKDELDKQTQEIQNGLETDSKNEANNNNNTTTNSNNNIIGSVVNFSNFLEMYTFSENKLNKSTNILSNGSGSAIINGTTSSSAIKLNNEKVNISFTRAQNSTQKYFTFDISGQLINNFYSLYYKTSVYAEGAIYYIYSNQNNDGWQTISQTAVQEKFNWTTNQTFHVINGNSIKNVETFYYDKYSKTYTGVAELNPNVSAQKLKYTMMGFMNASAPAEFLSSKITVQVDRYGNFKSIRYQDTFKINIYDPENKLTLYATINADYTETFDSTGNKVVHITKPKI